MVRSPILTWLDKPRGGAGIYAAGRGRQWDYLSYAEAAGLVDRLWPRVRESVVERATQEGDPPVVLLALPNDVTFIIGLFATVTAGCVASPFPPPGALGRRAEYVDHLASRINATGATAVLCYPALTSVVDDACERATNTPSRIALDLDRIAAEHPDRARVVEIDHPLLQFTSGSTGTPRGVALSWSNLNANLDAISAWLEWQPSDSVVTWLPPHHDMGLIGCILGSLAKQTDLWLLRPEQFVKHPIRWLEALTPGRATMTAAPTFGYEHSAAQMTRDDFASLNLRSWRVALVGAEPLRADALLRFGVAAAGTGFQLDTFYPAYGLAEATLCVTGKQPAHSIPFAVSKPAAALGGAVLRSAERLDVLGGEPDLLCSSGRTMGDLLTEIVDERGAPVDEGVVGEITVTGSSVAQPFIDGIISPAPVPLHTGDAGFVLDGELFVIGRIQTSRKIHGETVFVEDVERVMQRIPGLAEQRLVVILPPTLQPEVVLVTTALKGDWVEAAATDLRRVAGHHGTVRILRLPRSPIPLTPSGKPRRIALWASIVSGTTDIEVLHGPALGAPAGIASGTVRTTMHTSRGSR